MTNLCRPAEALEVIKSLLRCEFERKAVKEPGSILRGASLAAKMSSRHARVVGASYLSDLFSDWVKSAQVRHVWSRVALLFSQKNNNRICLN